MPFDEQLLSLVRCPITLSELRHLAATELAMLNRRIAEGAVVNRCGEPVSEQLDDALINEDKSWLMPVHDGILTLVAEQLISAKYRDPKCSLAVES